MPQPIRSFVDEDGQAWLVLDNGHRVALPAPSGNNEPAPPGITDHGDLTGLGDDDHPQYLKPDEVLAGTNVTVTTNPDGSVTIASTASGGTSDHGALTGLGDDDHTQYLPLTGSRPMTGNLQVNSGGIILNASGQANFIAQIAAGNIGGLSLRNGSSTRWYIFKDGNSEGGGNAGGDLLFARYSDAGAQLGNVLVLRRASGDAEFKGTVVLGADGTTGLEAITFRQVQKFSAYLSRTTDTTLTDATNYNVAWETWTTPNGNSADHGSMTVGSTGATISKAGMYIAMVRTSFTGTTAGRVATIFTKNGSAIRTDLRPFATGNTNQPVVTGLVDGAAGDKFSVAVAPYGVGTPKLAAAYLDIVGPI